MSDDEDLDVYVPPEDPWSAAERAAAEQAPPAEEPAPDEEPPLGPPPEDEYGPEEAKPEFELRDPEVLALGAALRSHGAAVASMDLTPDDFSKYPRIGALWATVQQRVIDGGLLDEAWLSDRHPAELAIVYSCTDEVHTWEGYAETWAGLVIARTQRAQVALELHEVVEHLPGATLDEVASSLREVVTDLEARAPRKALTWTRSLVREALDEPEDAGVQYASPWRSLNAVIGGFRPGAVYVIGARPGVGKSALALQAAHALSQHGKVALSTLEMSRREVTNRLIAQQVQIPFSFLSTPGKRPTDAMLDRMAVFAATDPGNIAVDDGSRRTVHDVRQHARDVAREGKLTGVVVDYLQLLSGTGGRSTPRHEQVAEMSRNLKILAGELQVPVIALSQLNRNSARGNQPPSVADLRESGAIEQDADVVVLLHRAEVDPANPDNHLHLMVAKNRQGEERTTQVEWQGMFVRAVDYPL